MPPRALSLSGLIVVFGVAPSLQNIDDSDTNRATLYATNSYTFLRLPFLFSLLRSCLAKPWCAWPKENENSGFFFACAFLCFDPRVRRRKPLPIYPMPIPSATAINRVFAIYQMMMGWKTYKSYLGNRRTPKTQGQSNPREMRLKRHLGNFFLTANSFPSVGIGLCR